MANPEEHRQSGVITRKGLLLKESREAKGITIETVHELTKIPLDVLHAIEEGYTVRMVSAYYFKGFIKMYAKFLGLDPQLVLDEPVPAKKNHVEEVVVPRAEAIRSSKFNDFLARQNKKQLLLRGVVGLIIIIVGIAIVLFVKNFKATPPALLVKREQPKKRVNVVPVSEKKVTEKSKAKPKAEEKPVSKPSVAPIPASTSADEDEQAPTRSAKRTEGKKVSLTIKARVTGWLQVKVDGNIVFQSTMREGTAESWQAEKSIELSGKNINNLEFEVNGKMLGQLGKAERGARRVMITSEGLSVRK